jgi:hypothetical protein
MSIIVHNRQKFVSKRVSVKLHRVCAIQVIVIVPEKHEEVGQKALEDAEAAIKFEITKARAKGGRYGQ